MKKYFLHFVAVAVTANGEGTGTNIRNEVIGRIL